jgi:S1-C subfamily serine protease
MMTFAEPLAPRKPSAANPWMICALMLACVAIVWQLWPRYRMAPDAVPRAITPRGDLTSEEKTTIEIFRQSSASVVHITTMAVRQDAFSLNVTQIPRGTGTGFVWDQDGHIVTNFHVIQGAAAAQVTLADQSEWKARLAGAYPDKDLAVLAIDAPRDRLRPVSIGTSNDLQVGQRVFAIGNPFGLDQSLTTGIISALGREIQSVTQRPIKDVIQTDAAINPGNSGGPLLDSAGRVIGVNTAIFSPSGTSAGIGFAIPVDEVNRIVPELIAHGKIVRPGMGIQVASDQIARQLGLKGVLILDVVPDGGAAKAGLRPTRRDNANHIILGDIIVAIDGHPTRAVKDLFGALADCKVGAVAKVKIRRGQEEQEVEVTLSAMP